MDLTESEGSRVNIPDLFDQSVQQYAGKYGWDYWMDKDKLFWVYNNPNMGKVVRQYEVFDPNQQDPEKQFIETNKCVFLRPFHIENSGGIKFSYEDEGQMRLTSIVKTGEDSIQVRARFLKEHSDELEILAVTEQSGKVDRILSITRDHGGEITHLTLFLNKSNSTVGISSEDSAISKDVYSIEQLKQDGAISFLTQSGQVVISLDDGVVNLKREIEIDEQKVSVDSISAQMTIEDYKPLPDQIFPATSDVISDPYNSKPEADDEWLKADLERLIGVDWKRLPEQKIRFTEEEAF